MVSNKFEESFPITIRSKKYGWCPDIPDTRDKFTNFPEILKFRNIVDLRDTGNIGEVYDQGNLASCVANALCSAFEYESNRYTNELIELNPSRLFLYYNQRVIQNTTEYDMGSTIRDGAKILNKLGVCDESKCQYNSSFFNIKPSVDAYLDAQNYKGIKYKKVRCDIKCIKSALTLLYPIVFGFAVYETFEDPEGVETTGIMELPDKDEKLIGGYTALIVGYNEETQRVLVQTSFGTNWALDGYFWMPYEFLLSGACSDFWVIEKNKKPTENRTMADVVRGYQIREDESDSDSDNNNNSYSDNDNNSEINLESSKPISKSDSKVSIVECS